MGSPGPNEIIPELPVMPVIADQEYDEQFELVRAKDGWPLKRKNYLIVRQDGSKESGQTDDWGHTHRLSPHNSAETVKICIETFQKKVQGAPVNNYPTISYEDRLYKKVDQRQTTVVEDKEPKEVVCCICSGDEVAYIDEVAEFGRAVPKYHGQLPAPHPQTFVTSVIYIRPGVKVQNVATAVEVRNILKDAAEYHGIPQVLMALILKQENGPNATERQKQNQLLERQATTTATQAERDIIPEGASKKLRKFEIADTKPFEKAFDGSSGVCNLRGPTLKGAIEYTIDKYCKPLIRETAQRTLGIKDTGISGIDWRADLYYGAAHIRELIDRVKHRCYNGPLTKSDIKAVIRAYNGSGPAAEQYSKDAMAYLELVIKGKAALHFYE